MNLYGENVIHKAFGKGKIVEFANDCLTVLFNENVGEKKFVYPTAFETFLELENKLLYTEIQEDKAKLIKKEVEGKRIQEEHANQVQIEGSSSSGNAEIKGNMEQMLEYIEEASKDLDISIEKRSDGGFIAVANEMNHLAKGRNVFTYWTTSYSVAVIILRLLPRTTYHCVEDMEKDQVAAKIRAKYNEIVG